MSRSVVKENRMPLSLVKKLTALDYLFIILFDAAVFFAGYKFYEYRLRESGATRGSMLID